MAKTPKQKAKIAVGEEWIGFICVNQACGMPILVARIRPEMLDETDSLTIRGGDQLLTCPYCQRVSAYPAEQAKRFQAVQKH